MDILDTRPNLTSMVLCHDQQIKDLAAHLLELKQLITPMMEFKREQKGVRLTDAEVEQLAVEYVVEENQSDKQGKKCAVKDCENHMTQGKFIGLLCAPCHCFVSGGGGLYSQAYRNSRAMIDLAVQMERERITKMLNHLYIKAPCGHEETVVKGSLVHCKKCNHCFGVD